MRDVFKLGLELREDLNEKGITIGENFIIKVFSDTVEFILDDNGKRVFGGEVTVTGYKRFRTEREVKINKGSLGSVDNTCVATVETINLMCAALNNWEEFAESCEVVMDKMEELNK